MTVKKKRFKKVELFTEAAESSVRLVVKENRITVIRCNK